MYDSWRVTDLSSDFKDESWRADCCHYSGRRTFLLGVVGKGDPSGVASLNDARKFVLFKAVPLYDVRSKKNECRSWTAECSS